MLRFRNALVLLVLLSFAAVGCAPTEPDSRFHYGDRVMITSGFYEGQQGMIVGWHRNTGDFKVSLDWGGHAWESVDRFFLVEEAEPMPPLMPNAPC